MSTQDFRRKYRPRRFSEFAGNRVTIKILTNMIKTGRIPTGILFHGPPGTGKTSLAYLLIKALYCQNFSRDLCGKCEGCLAHRDNFSTLFGEYFIHDCTALDKKGFEDILSGFRYSPPARTKRHIHIFDEFHRTKEPLQERLLRPLEVRNNILLIFCLIDLEAVNEAFQQRVMVLKTNPPEPDELIPWLSRVCTDEDIIVKDKDALNHLISFSGRLPRECLSLLEKISSLGEPLTTKLVKTVAQHSIPST